MLVTRQQLHDLIDGLPEQEMEAAQRFLLFLSQESIGEEFAKSVRRGLAQAEAGETIECGPLQEMVDRLLTN